MLRPLLILALLSAACGEPDQITGPDRIACICLFRRVPDVECRWETRPEDCQEQCTEAHIAEQTEDVNRDQCGE